MFVREGKNCLLNEAVNLPEVNTNQITYPGQRFNADEQCQLLYGPSSFYCAVSTNPSSRHFEFVPVLCCERVVLGHSPTDAVWF